MSLYIRYVLLNVRDKNQLYGITVSKQKGVVYYGLFAIAYSTAKAFGDNHCKLKLKQEALRSHLDSCFRL